ncbi:MAG: GTPase domain-containing protein [Acidobacteria bacterium]|nr:GTPase domain-containing protein [Acidobacteriota bacterium]
MVFFNYSTMQMVAKIVYYGPGLCGKTTNLNHIYEKTSPKSRGEMVSLATETDRTLFFDLLPLDVGLVGGFKTKFQLYTVPGQVFYNATRKLVLKGVDGIVFVADSQVPMFEANQDSMANMWENLEELGLDFGQIPIVLQYNKRDLPHIMPIDKLNAALNEHGFPFVEASAIQGAGVFETLKEISKATLLKLKNKVLGDELKKSKGNTVEFKVQGSKSIKKAIEEEGGRQDSIYEQTRIEKSDPGLPTVEEFEPLPVPEQVTFEDYTNVPPSEELGEVSKINFDTIDLDGLEEEIESIDEEDAMLTMTEEVDLTTELEEVEFDEKTGAHYEHLMEESEELDDTAPSNKPPHPPIPPAKPKANLEESLGKVRASNVMNDLEKITSSLKTTTIKTDSVDDLLSDLVTGVKAPAKKEWSKHHIQLEGKLGKTQINCIFLDKTGSVIHTQLLQVKVHPNGPGKYELRLSLDIEET